MVYNHLVEEKEQTAKFVLTLSTYGTPQNLAELASEVKRILETRLQREVPMRYYTGKEVVRNDKNARSGAP